MQQEQVLLRRTAGRGDGGRGDDPLDAGGDAPGRRGRRRGGRRRERQNRPSPLCLRQQQQQHRGGFDFVAVGCDNARGSSSSVDGHVPDSARHERAAREHERGRGRVFGGSKSQRRRRSGGGGGTDPGDCCRRRRRCSCRRCCASSAGSHGRESSQGQGAVREVEGGAPGGVGFGV